VYKPFRRHCYYFFTTDFLFLFLYISEGTCLLGDVLKANLVAVVLRIAARSSTVLPGSEAGCGTRKTVGASLSQGEAFVVIVVFAVSLETWSVVRKQFKRHAVMVFKYPNVLLIAL
jgi:hypothetical protein